MTTAIQRRRGTTAEHSTFTGLEGEISVNTTKDTLIVHDGSTAGGFELARADGSNFVATSVDINGGSIDGTTIGASSASSGAFTTLSASGEITANGGIALGDNGKATFGASDDLQIYHDGSNSRIVDAGTGYLKIQATDRVAIRSADDSTKLADFYTDGAVKLYYANAEKLTTTSTGIDVTGTATMDGLTVGSASGVFPSEVLQIRGNGGASGYINGFGLGASNSQLRVFADDTNNTLGSIKFDIRNRDRILIQDTGDISFYEDTGTTPKFFWDASAESLGIGTSSPAHSLDVVKAGSNIIRVQNSTSSADASFYATNTVGTGIFGMNATGQYMYGLGNFPLLFYANGAERFRISSAGFVGIGTSSPASKLDIVGLNKDAIKIRSDVAPENYYQIGRNQSTGLLEFFGSEVTYNGYLFKGPSSDLMAITSAGNVGIGTSSPSEKLEIAGSNQALAENNTLRFTDTDTSSQTNQLFGKIEFNSLDSDAASPNRAYILSAAENSLTPSYIAFGTAPQTSAATERMRISSAGELLVGKTASAIGTAGTEIYGTGVITSTRAGNILDLNRLSTDGNIAQFRKDGTVVGSIGNIGNDLTAGSGDVALRFSSGNNDIRPWNVSTNAVQDATISLGFSTGRFKDLYLSGTGYFGTSVGIGTSSPDGILDIEGNFETSKALVLTNTKGTGKVSYVRSHGGNGETLALYHDGVRRQTWDSNGSATFESGGTEAMRISAGNVLVGTSDTAPGAGNTATGVAIRGGADNRSFFSVASNYVASFNRNSDGPIVEFNQSGLPVGSIGTKDDDLTIGTGDTGLRFLDGAEEIRPWDTANNAIRDNAISLGSSGGRFKDLYLSGGVYLGGTGAANKLDDYEEGTWTPQIYYQNATDQGNATNTTQTGYYTKIGRVVTVYFKLIWNITGSPANDNIGVKNLPFGGDSNTFGAGGVAYPINNSTTIPTLLLTSPGNGGTILLAQDGEMSSNLGNEFGSGNAKEIKGTVVYFTDA